LVGGTPCQSFSVAGLRKGLADERGNLTLEFIRLAQRTRPRWILWENVPGVLSDQSGAFGSLLGGLAECGYGFAYRVLDAQHFGVPQRRRRVFLVGYLGDWRPPAAVLFEREGLCGDITPGRKARQSIAGTFKSGSGSGSWNNSADYAAAGYMIPATHTLRGDGFDASEDGTGRGTPLVAGTVSSKWAKGTGGPAGDECQNLIADPIAYNVTFC
ncbi:MAG: DNA (cytosine-5-)-methyltransferase, partial [Anaerolineae bacterium]|nr:DNA (cytosine-5-)-methyltransferase [Anaerolineae bacterium]